VQEFKEVLVLLLARRDGCPHPLVIASNANTLNYLLSPTEQFARAYSQWIVERGSNKTLKKELKSVLKRIADAISPWETQWSAAEFEPIAEAFDALFSDLGLLK